jgi:hypothetical protein
MSESIPRHINCPSCSTAQNITAAIPVIISCSNCSSVLAFDGNNVNLINSVAPFNEKTVSVISLHDTGIYNSKKFTVTGLVNRITDGYILNQWILNLQDGTSISLTE